MICLPKFKKLNIVSKDRNILCHPGDVSIWDWININSFIAPLQPVRMFELSQAVAETVNRRSDAETSFVDGIATGIDYLPPSYGVPLSAWGKAFEGGHFYHNLSDGNGYIFSSSGWLHFSSIPTMTDYTIAGGETIEYANSTAFLLSPTYERLNAETGELEKVRPETMGEQSLRQQQEERFKE